MSRTLEAKNKFTALVANRYDEKWQRNKKYNEEFKLIRSILYTYPQGTNIVDVGCGTGRYIEVYKECKHTALCLDINNTMLDKARSKLTYPQDSNIKLVHGNILNLQSSTVYSNTDIILCTRLISLLDEQDILKIMCVFIEINPQEVILSSREPIVGINDNKYTCPRDIIIQHWTNINIQQILNTDFYLYRLSNRKALI